MLNSLNAFFSAFFIIVPEIDYMVTKISSIVSSWLLFLWKTWSKGGKGCDCNFQFIWIRHPADKGRMSLPVKIYEYCFYYSYVCNCKIFIKLFKIYSCLAYMTTSNKNITFIFNYINEKCKKYYNAISMLIKLY